MALCENCMRPLENEDDRFCPACNKPVTRLARKAKVVGGVGSGLVYEEIKEKGGKAVETTKEKADIVSSKAKRTTPVLERAKDQVGNLAKRIRRKARNKHPDKENKQDTSESPNE